MKRTLRCWLYFNLSSWRLLFFFFYGWSFLGLWGILSFHLHFIIFSYVHTLFRPFLPFKFTLHQEFMSLMISQRSCNTEYCYCSCFQWFTIKRYFYCCMLYLWPIMNANIASTYRFYLINFIKTLHILKVRYNVLQLTFKIHFKTLNILKVRHNFLQLTFKIHFSLLLLLGLYSTT
jgi:hypothetical protein